MVSARILLKNYPSLISLNYLFLLVFAFFLGLAISIYSFAPLIIFLGGAFFLFFLKFPLIALFLLIAYLPFQIALNPAEGIDLASGRVFILVLFAVWILVSLAKKRLVFLNTIQTWLLELFLFISFLSLFFAQDLERAGRKLLVFISIFPLYFLVSAMIKKKRDILKLIWVMIASAVAIALIGLGQFLSQFIFGINYAINFWTQSVVPLFYGQSFGQQVITTPSWLVNIGGETYLRAFSLFPDPHMFGFYLGLIIPLVFSFLILDRNKKRQKILLSIIFTLLFAALLVSFSRSAYLGMFFALVTVIILSWKFLRTTIKAIFLLLFLAILIWLLVIPNNPLTARLISSFDLEEGSNVVRLENFQQAIEIIKDNPWQGVGLGNYSLAIDPLASYRLPIYAHNTYLDIAAETGIFNAIVWILLFAITIWQLIKLARRSYAVEPSIPIEIPSNPSGSTGLTTSFPKGETEGFFLGMQKSWTQKKNEQADSHFDRFLSVGLTGSLIWFAASSLFDTAIYSPTVLAMLIVILGLSGAVNQISKLENRF